MIAAFLRSFVRPSVLFTRICCSPPRAVQLLLPFAAAFLVNLLRLKFASLLDETQKQGIVFTVSHLIDVLGSQVVAVDGRHTPALYSRFLSSLLAKHGVVKIDRFESPKLMHRQDVQDERPATTHSYSWPDVSPIDTQPMNNQFSDGAVYQEHGEADMNFSVTHFVRTVSQDSPPNYYDVQATHIPETTPHWDLWGSHNDRWITPPFSQPRFQG